MTGRFAWREPASAQRMAEEREFIERAACKRCGSPCQGDEVFPSATVSSALGFLFEEQGL